MTTMTLEPATAAAPEYMPAAVEKVSIIISKGSIEGVYPGLIMASGARADGIEANLFFTFFGLDAITKARFEHMKVASVGNPGLHIATWLGGVPGMSAVITKYMESKMGKIDVPTVPEFLELLADSGCGLYACKMSVDMFGLAKDDFIPQVADVIDVGEFYAKAKGGHIIFT
jgi:peroxiredoxin family protein